MQGIIILFSGKSKQAALFIFQIRQCTSLAKESDWTLKSVP